MVVLEHHIKEELPQRQGALALYKDKRYADTVLSFYKKGL